MVPITQDFISAGRRNRPAYPLTPVYITIHDTGNTSKGADALSHAKYLKGDVAANAPVSWHYTVDDRQIVQHLPLDENGWHCGDGKDGPGNRTTIGVEIAENSDGNRAQAEANAAELVASLLRQHNLMLDKVVQHNHWKDKNCPRVLRGRPRGWEGFLGQVQGFLTPPVTDGARLIVHDKEIPGGAILIDGKSYVWTRGFAEALGHTVRWDAATRTVYVDSEPVLPRIDRYPDYDVITCKPSQIAPTFVRGILRQDGINGSYLDASLNPLGIVVIDGQEYYDRITRVPPRTCLIITKDGYARIAKVNKASEVLAKHILGGGPALLPDVATDEGFQPDIMTSKRERTAVGINDDGNLLLVTTAPMKLAELSDLMAGLGCRQAVNLDGGGSTSMRFGGELIRGGSRAISTALILREG